MFSKMCLKFFDVLPAGCRISHTKNFDNLAFLIVVEKGNNEFKYYFHKDGTVDVNTRPVYTTKNLRLTDPDLKEKLLAPLRS